MRPLGLLAPLPFLIPFLCLAQSPVSFELNQNAATLGLSTVYDATQADFNNDGKPDLLTVNSVAAGQANFSLRLGNGDGTFQAPIQVGSSQLSSAFVAADVNGDGFIDLVAVAHSQIIVLPGTGTGSFGQPIVSTISLAEFFANPVPGDFNGDKHIDIAVADSKGNIDILQNTGDGHFTLANTISLAVNGPIYSLASGDVDSDGKTDLAVVDSGGDAHLLWALGKNNFRDVTLNANTATSNPASSVSIGDLNQDGSADVLVSYDCSSPVQVTKGLSSFCTGIDVFYGGQGTQATFYRHAVSDPTVDATFFLVPADVNGDGIADLVGDGSTLNNSQEGLVVWLGHADGSFEQTAHQFPATSNGGGNRVVAGDFNRDGMVDFLLPGTNTGYPDLGTTALYINATPQAACATSQISTTVVACQPVDNTYVPGPQIQAQATAYDRTPVTALQEYLDDRLVYSQSVTNFNIRLPISTGPHLLVSKAWDANGVSFRSNRHVTVYNGVPGAVCAATLNSASLCLPSGATAKSPVHILANGATSAIPTATQLYIDGTLVVNDTTHSTLIDTTQTLSPGNHDLVFKLYDANGKTYTASKSVSVQ